MSGPQTVGDGTEVTFQCMRTDLDPEEGIIWQVNDYSGTAVPFETGRNQASVQHVLGSSINQYQLFETVNSQWIFF